MTDTIYQPRLVVNLLVQHAGKVSINLIHIRPILNVLLQMVEHIGNLNIGTAVKRPFQRTDTRCNRRISIRPGRRSYTYSKRRVVTAAMLCLQHQQQVESTSIQFRIILFQHIQEVFCERKIFLWMTDVQRTAMSGMAKHIEGVGYDSWEL